MSAPQMTAEMAAKVSTSNMRTLAALKVFAAFDFTPGYDLDKRLKADPKLLAEFIKDPAGVAKREVGLVAPPGAHMHFINEKNEYFPPEGDAISQLHKGHTGEPWGRVEVRTAIGPGCYALCIGCL